MTLDVTHLMMLEADKVAPVSDRRIASEIRLLSETDVRNFAWEPEYRLNPEYAARLLFGFDFCAGAFVEGRLAAYAWYALSSIEAKNNRGRSRHSGTSMTFPEHMAFLYQAFTHPDFRREGFYADLHRFAFDALAGRGVTAILATCDWSNRSALANSRDLGFRNLGKIWRFGVGSSVAGIYPRVAKSLGIRIGRGVVPATS